MAIRKIDGLDKQGNLRSELRDVIPFEKGGKRSSMRGQREMRDKGIEF